MNIIIPMAGMGKRLRPHTLTIPKPLIPVAGKPIVQRLAEDISQTVKSQINEIAFIIGDFGEEVENQLLGIATALGAKGKIYYQHEALGTAHAVLCAASSLEGEVVVAFADTLFEAQELESDRSDGIIWVHKVKDPSQFGVVTLNDENIISGFAEKPEKFVSDLAIIGIYYFKDGRNLRDELQFLIDNNVCKNGEYQLTDALANMMNKGIKFSPGIVERWLDCGNKNAVVSANRRILERENVSGELISGPYTIENSIIIPPCLIGQGTIIKNSVIGPHVTIGKDSSINDSIIANSLLQNNITISKAILDNSMIGNQVRITGKNSDISLGDFSEII